MSRFRGEPDWSEIELLARQGESELVRRRLAARALDLEVHRLTRRARRLAWAGIAAFALGIGAVALGLWLLVETAWFAIIG